MNGYVVISLAFAGANGSFHFRHFITSTFFKVITLVQKKTMSKTEHPYFHQPEMNHMSCSKILLTTINVKTTLYWHHVRRSDVKLTADRRTWCQYDVVLTHINCTWNLTLGCLKITLFRARKLALSEWLILPIRNTQTKFWRSSRNFFKRTGRRKCQF